MFLHPGIIHFPEIPLLEVLDVWIGIGPDTGRILYKIDRRGIWSRDYVIVGTNNYIYSVYGDLGTFSPRGLSLSSEANSVVRNNTVSWASGTQLLHYDAVRGWVIDSPAYGEGNYYAVSWGADGLDAYPRGPWLGDDDPPDDVWLDVSWPRLQGRAGYGTITEVDNYTPATTYVVTPLTGSITVGCPSWQGSIDGESRVIYKTLDCYDDAHSGKISYCFEDNPNKGFKWSRRRSRYEYDGDNGLYYAQAPITGTSWTVTWEHNNTTSTVSLSWGGWKRGTMGEDDWVCEIGRIV